jgi:hypothetical protein
MGHNRAICLQAPNARFGWIAILRRDPLGRLGCADCSRSLDDDGATEFHSIKPSNELALSTPAPALAKGSVNRHGSKAIGHEISRQTRVCQ